MILNAEERQDLDILLRLVDEAVVLRNQMLRAEREATRASQQVEELRRSLEIAAMRVEKQREKMALDARLHREVRSIPSRA